LGYSTTENIVITASLSQKASWTACLA